MASQFAIIIGCGEVGEKVEDVLKVPEDRMVDRKLAVENFLEVGSDVS